MTLIHTMKRHNIMESEKSYKKCHYVSDKALDKAAVSSSDYSTHTESWTKLTAAINAPKRVTTQLVRLLNISFSFSGIDVFLSIFLFV